MQNLTQQQLRKSIYNYHHSDIFDHVLLDDREENGRIVTVLKYDEETILIQVINNGEDITCNKYPNEVFLKALQS